MNILVVFVHVLIISTITVFVFSAQAKVLRPYFFPALLFKCICGLLVGWLYMKFYLAGDTLLFFQDGKTLTAIARENFAEYLSVLFADRSSIGLSINEPRSVFFIKLASIILFVTYDSYWITAVYFSIVSFAGAWFFVAVIHRLFPEATIAAVISFLFFPSIVFWSSGLIKESFASGALFFLAGCFVLGMKRERLTVLHVLLIIVSMWILWSLKYYYLAVFGAVAITSLISFLLLPRIFTTTSSSQRLLSWLGIFMVLLVIVSFLHPNFYLSRIMTVIVDNYYAFVQHSSPGDIIVFEGLKPEFTNLVANAPKAFIYGLFSPFVWQATNTLQYLAATENIIILLLAILSLTQYKRILTVDRQLVCPWLMFIVVMSTFITLSTPNFGTLSRYRVGYLSFFVFLILINNPLVNLIVRRFSLFSKA